MKAMNADSVFGRPGRCLVLGLLVLAGTTAVALAGPVSVSPIPKYDHVVVAIEENHSYSEVVDAPYIASLMKIGTTLTNYYAVSHPSEPNYLALFSGSTQGISDDDLHTVTAPNLYGALNRAGYSFAGYSEGLPAAGYSGDEYGNYARKHAPWVSFSNVPSSVNLPFTDFPSDYAKLPTVSFVIPNQENDMHDGSVQAGDSWLETHLSNYIQWARAHNSLFILTFDEGHDSQGNRVLTLLVGAGVPEGKQLDASADHYSLLRTIESMYKLAPTGRAAMRSPLTGVWASGSSN